MLRCCPVCVCPAGATACRARCGLTIWGPRSSSRTCTALTPLCWPWSKVGLHRRGTAPRPNNHAAQDLPPRHPTLLPAVHHPLQTAPHGACSCSTATPWMWCPQRTSSGAAAAVFGWLAGISEAGGHSAGAGLPPSSGAHTARYDFIPSAPSARLPLPACSWRVTGGVLDVFLLMGPTPLDGEGCSCGGGSRLHAPFGTAACHPEHCRRLPPMRGPALSPERSAGPANGGGGAPSHDAPLGTWVSSVQVSAGQGRRMPLLQPRSACNRRA